MMDERTIRLETSLAILTEADELLEKGYKVKEVCRQLALPKKLYISLRKEYLELCREEELRLEVLKEGNRQLTKLLDGLAVNDAINTLNEKGNHRR